LGEVKTAKICFLYFYRFLLLVSFTWNHDKTDLVVLLGVLYSHRMTFPRYIVSEGINQRKSNDD